MSNTQNDRTPGDSAARMKEAIQTAVTSALKPIHEKLGNVEGIEQSIRQFSECAHNTEKQHKQIEALISEGLGDLTTRLDGIYQRFGEVDQRLQGLGGHLGHIDERLNEVDVQVVNSVEASYQAYNIGCGSGFTRPFKPIPARIITSSPNTHTLDVDTQSDNVSDSGRTVVVSPVDHGLPHLSNVEMINQLRSDQLDLYLTFYNIQNDESLSHEQKVDKLKARIGCNFSAPRKDGSGAMIMVWCTIILLVAHWYF